MFRPALTLLALLALAACNFAPTQTPLPPSVTPVTVAPTDTEVAIQTASAQVEAILAHLTPLERVGQMFMVGFTAGEPDPAALVERTRAGGVVLFEQNVGTPQETAALVNRLQAAALEATGIPLLVATDQEGGVVAQLRRGFTYWPNAMAVAATGNLDIAERVGAGIAEELRAVGISMNLAPVVDVVDNPANTVIGVRSFGSNPGAVAAFGQATLRGFHSMGVIAVAEHFPGHGSVAQDSRTTRPVDARSRAEIDATLAPFAALIADGIDAVLLAHVVYPALSDDGLPATFSPTIATDLLRGQLGFQGVIVSDAPGMDAVLEQYSVEEAAQRAILAGADMLILSQNISAEQQAAAVQHVVTLVEAGEISPARIDASARRILSLKERYGLLAWEPIAPQGIAFHLSAHQTLSYEAAAYAVTLLRDQAGLLPLDPNRAVTVIYPLDFFGVPDIFRVYDPDVRAIGVTYAVSQAERSQALAAAEEGEQIVMLTLDVSRFPGQGELVRALPAGRTVVAAIRSPFDVLAFPGVNAYLLTYSGNDYALDALARVLYGQLGAQGRLPVEISGATLGNDR